MDATPGSIRGDGLKILFVNRPRSSGGDWVSFDGFARELVERGAEIRFSSVCHAHEVAWADVVHSYNVTFPWTENAVRMAKAVGRPCVVTAIFFPRWIHAWDPARLRATITAASAVLVYGSAERDEIVAGLPGLDAKFVTMWKGHDASFLAPPDAPRGIDVLCVGSIEPRKNQAAVIAATSALGISPLVIGHPLNLLYARQCRKIGRAAWMGRVPRREMPALFAASRVFVQASLYDPAPNTAIEAALAGCRVVLSTRTSYGRWPGAWMCDPASPESIRDAIAGALAAPPSDALQRHMQSIYCWDSTIDDLVRCYRDVIERPRGAS